MWLKRCCIKRIFFALSVLSVFFCSCKKDNHERSKNKSLGDEFITNSLLEADYHIVDEDISLAIFKNKIFFFSQSEDGFSDDRFMLHLIRQEKSFLNLDFDADQARLAKESLDTYRNLDILYYQWNNDAYSYLRTGQYKRISGSIKKNWEIKIDLNSSAVNPHLYKNELFESLGEHLRHKDFIKKLDKGTFFKIRHDFYILLADNMLYLITDKNRNLNDKFMLHFIPEEGEFVNSSFRFELNQYQNFLLAPYKDFSIAQIRLPENLENFKKLRIGQFNQEGNIWVQVMTIEDLLTNELLRYQGELNSPLNDK